MFENYLKYLDFITSKLDKFFLEQKPYIFCKKGCGKCCKNANFPYSKIEASYLIYGALNLDDSTKKIVEQNIRNILNKNKDSSDNLYKYDCPYLIDDICCVYKYRGILCRSFGLLNVSDTGKVKAPFCSFQGLNYSNVMEDDGCNISIEKFKKLGIKEEPVAYLTTYKYLTDSDFEKTFNLEFGDTKPLIYWLEHKNEILNSNPEINIF